MVRKKKGRTALEQYVRKNETEAAGERIMVSYRLSHLPREPV